jgi:hypothetical protein
MQDLRTTITLFVSKTAFKLTGHLASVRLSRHYIEH